MNIKNILDPTMNSKLGKVLMHLVVRRQVDQMDYQYSEVHYEKGEVVLKEDAFFTHLILVKKGILKQTRRTKRDRNTILKYVLTNELVGVELLKGSEYSPFTITSLSESELIFIKKEDLFSLADNYNYLNDIITSTRSYYFQAVVDRMMVLSNYSVYGKVVYILAYLHELGKKCPEIFNYVLRKDIAELAGVSLESVMKILNELKNEGYVSFDDKKIQIVEKDEMIERYFIA